MKAQSSVISSGVERSIIQTLKYSDYFGFPLTTDEIHLRLIGSPIRRIGLIRQIRQMLKTKLIARTGNFYHLPGRKSLVARRRRRAQLSHPLLSRAHALAAQLVHVPGIIAIYLTGSLAMQNTDGTADIDFMIVADNGRLWTTRLLLTIYTEVFGLRRHPHSTENSGKLCLNLYLSPVTFSLPPDKRSLYTAYELIQAVPLYDPHNSHSALLAANPWIHNFLPNFPLPAASKRTLLKRNSRLQAEKGPVAAGRRVLMGTFEFLAYHLQLAYMQGKLTREYVTPDSAFFHPHNPGAKVLRKLSSKV